MFLERYGTFWNKEILEAILNGYTIELPRKIPITEKIMNIALSFKKWMLKIQRGLLKPDH